LSSPESTYVTIAGTALSAKKTVAAGYSFTICFKCTSTAQTTPVSFNWVIKQIRDCNTYIADAASQTSATQLLAYSSTASTTETILRTSIFTILGESDCGVTSCALYQGGGSCNAAYTTTDSQITIDGSYSIIVKRTVSAGFGPVSLCYKCSSNQANGGGNTGNSKMLDLTIQQVMDCSSGTALTTKA